MKKKISIASAVLIVTIVVILLSASLSSNPHKVTPIGTPPLQYICSFSPSGGVIANATQGSTQQINITLKSTTGQQITVPIEDLKMTYYSPTVDLNNWINTDNDTYPALQAKAFNYSFSLYQLTLQPQMSNSTILTINVADDAPLGEYFFFIDFGTIIGSEYPYSSTNNIGLVVTPNSSPSPTPTSIPVPTPAQTNMPSMTYCEVSRETIGNDTQIRVSINAASNSSQTTVLNYSSFYIDIITMKADSHYGANAPCGRSQEKLFPWKMELQV